MVLEYVNLAFTVDKNQILLKSSKNCNVLFFCIIFDVIVCTSITQLCLYIFLTFWFSFYHFKIYYVRYFFSTVVRLNIICIDM